MIPEVEPIKVLAMLFQQELEIAAGQIMLGLENWAIPKEKGLYVALLYGPDQVIGNNSTNSLVGGIFTEVQEAVMLHQIDVDLMSFNSEARLRKEEFLMALTSFRAGELMEQYQMRIGSVPGSFAPVQSPEEAKQLNRFQITVPMYAIHVKTKVVPYYDSLETPIIIPNA